MRIIIYEDNPDTFYPLINLYPQFNLRIGMKTIAEHTKQYFARAKVDYIGRDMFRFKKINTERPTIYLSGRCILTKNFVCPKNEVKFKINNRVIGFIKYKAPFPKNLKEIDKVLKTTVKIEKLSGFVLDNIWDLIKYNENLMIRGLGVNKSKGKILKGVYVIGNRKNLYVAKNAIIHSQVALDLSDGPIYIDKGAIIKPFTTIVGPSYIGMDSIIDRAKIIKSSIGPVCRISGEVEACIFQGYANKAHEGFIGHSFIGEWVNLGALTTNSDLKNNYSSIKIKIGKKQIDSGMTKLGCFIGDHTKTGIGTLIPTGAVIGSFVNFFGGMMPQYVPSFKWLSTKKVENYDFKKALATAKIVMKRRSVTMTKNYEHIVRTYYKNR